MKTRQGPDALLLLSTFLLLGIGLVMVYSSSSVWSLYKFDISYYYLRRQGIFALMGLAVMFLCSRFNYWNWRRLVQPVFWVNLALLVLVFVPGIGFSRSEAQRWINLGFVQFQPTDVTKFAMVLFTANYLVAKKEYIHTFKRGLLPVLIIAGITSCLIMMQPDLGTTLTILLTVFILLYGGGVRILHLSGVAVAGGSIIAGLMLFVPRYRYQLSRLTSFLNPWEDPTGTGWQIIQSLLAIGSGSLGGVGLGASRQKFLYLPEPWSDFIYAIICEELGFIGGAAVIILFLILIWRGFRIAISAPDLFGKYLAMGLTTIIAVQAAINLGVVLGTLPVTGITLPLVSYGGTSLMMNLTFIGILLNISRYAD
ncbi:MAG: putative lipid II flippase FtsW [Bacillota bacterium]|nr:putative lipid II flippase FtsW [Bacillota bacterium]HOC06920.1 putative lipid II flippase FtsW [Bacillota bacterium]HPZ21635.1 putative lipid II flippase FtsW [Bacillota bacterium]HQD20414.1 putative lipid II flippase FtsW [Bacillota bacterium]